MALLFLLRIRFLWVTLRDRIGHLALEPDIYLKQKYLGLLPPHLGILVAPRDQTANETLLDLWAKTIPTVSHPILVRTALLFWRFRFLWYDFKPYLDGEIGEPATYYDVYGAWGDRPPVLRLPAELVARGDAALESIGIPRDAWIVCFHVRESGYALQDDHLHSFRNCDITNYLAAAAEIVKRGGWCVRMGNPQMRPLPPSERFFDYAHSTLRTDWMDIYLCYRCRIFVGTTSGLVTVPLVLGRPCATTNFIPISRPPSSPKGLGIPKLLRESGAGRLWDFKEMVMREPTKSVGDNAGIPGIEILENGPDDILNIVRELLDEEEGKRIFDDSDRLRQERFLSIYPAGHFASRTKSRVSPSFLRKYEHLLPL